MEDTNLGWVHMYNPAFNLHCKTNTSQRETAQKHWKGNDHSGNHKKHQSWRDILGLKFPWLLTINKLWSCQTPRLEAVAHGYNEAH